MTIDSPQRIAPPPVPRKLNSVDRLEIPLTHRSGGGRGDHLPEDTLYIDRGCGDDCTRSLECPYPRCRYDEPPVSSRQKLLMRDKAIVEARVKEGLTIAAIAARFSVGPRTIFRALKSARTHIEPDTGKRREETP